MNYENDVVRLNAALRHLRKAHDELCCVVHDSEAFEKALNQCRATITSVQEDLWNKRARSPRELAREAREAREAG